ncbi:hypothetical protein [Aeromicrobium fastidiosum]|uniref:Uncharacterized protein n=1 Tax=Aeromicrobium fastidiosum TaxID=52699 RepID=A0A641AI61_9ACTN|nr:hypothetical protein [Aeromicrobium fastidiosum]KAA1373655.1 hypothetical protein ESP62_017010 [Aeromicrobium fastidiosum]MBP2391210.1 hypothetical protein [Aeromicrobium fastidiosum]
MTDTHRFEFDWQPSYRHAARLFGVTPRRAWVKVGDGRLIVRFGGWTLTSALDNVAGTDVTGPYAFVKTAGPPHLSLADRGITFATNGERGLCVSFREPVPGIDPTRRIRHPGATITVADVDGLARALGHPS